MKMQEEILLHKVFERVFFRESRASQVVLINFINAILTESLSSPIKQIICQQYQKSYLLKDFQLGLNIKAQTRAKEIVQIGIQVHQQDYFQNQSNSLIFHHINNKGEDEDKVARFLIHLLNFNLLQEYAHYHNCYQTVHSPRSNPQQNTEIHYLELLKFKTKRPKSSLEKWLYFIHHVGRKTPNLFYEHLTKIDPYIKLADHLYQRTRSTIVIKEDQFNLDEWREHGQLQEKEQIAMNMIKAGFSDQEILKVIDITKKQLEDLALTAQLL